MSTAPPILAARLGDRLAGFQRVEAGDLLQPGLDEVGGLEQDVGALAGLYAWPGAAFEGFVRGLHREVDVRLAGLRVARHDEAVAGAAALQRAAVGGVDMLAADEELVALRGAGGF